MQRLLSAFTLLCIVLMSASAAFAAGAEGHKLPWSDFVFRIITFGGVVAVIAFFFGKKIVGFFKGRTTSIADEIAALGSQKASAQQQLQDVEKRIANLDKEREAILTEYRAQGEALKAAIIMEAEKNAAAIARQAKLTVQNEVDQAINAMRAEMADKITEAMEKQLSKKLSAEEHTKLIDKYLTKVVLN